jgi:NADP-dependent 3-hydroxy acid dehydrogenase YdfG
MAGKNGIIGHSLYCATKHALKGFTDSLRLEVKPKGIRVTGLHPGGMKTDIFDGYNFDISGYMDPKGVADFILNIAESKDDMGVDEVDINRMTK